MIEPAAQEREALRRQVGDRRRGIQTAVEPGFTVCWSLEATSIRCWACSERRCADTTSSRMRFCSSPRITISGGTGGRERSGARQPQSPRARRVGSPPEVAPAACLRCARAGPRAPHSAGQPASSPGAAPGIRATAPRNPAGGDMRFDLARVAGVEFAVDQRVQQYACFLAISSRLTPAFGRDPGASRNRSRARNSRDITVPTGTPMRAMSRYDISSISRSTRHSRSSAGNSPSVPAHVLRSCRHRLRLGRGVASRRPAWLHSLIRTRPLCPRKPRHVAHDPQEPGARLAAKRGKIIERAVTFLHHVLGPPDRAPATARACTRRRDAAARSGNAARRLSTPPAQYSASPALPNAALIAPRSSPACADAGRRSSDTCPACRKPSSSCRRYPAPSSGIPAGFHVTVCGMSSSFFHTTRVPAFTVSVAGVKVKLSMVTAASSARRAAMPVASSTPPGAAANSMRRPNILIRHGSLRYAPSRRIATIASSFFPRTTVTSATPRNERSLPALRPSSAPGSARSPAPAAGTRSRAPCGTPRCPPPSG